MSSLGCEELNQERGGEGTTRQSKFSREFNVYAIDTCLYTLLSTYRPTYPRRIIKSNAKTFIYFPFAAERVYPSRAIGFTSPRRNSELHTSTVFSRKKETKPDENHRRVTRYSDSSDSSRLQGCERTRKRSRRKTMTKLKLHHETKANNREIKL